MIRVLTICLLVVGCGQLSKEWKCSVEGNECEAVDKQGPSDGEDDGNERVGPRGPAGRDVFSTSRFYCKTNSISIQGIR